MAGSGKPLPAIFRVSGIVEDISLTAIQGMILAAIALLAIAAYSDIRTFRIPNVLVGAIAALGILRLVVLGNPAVAIFAVGVAVLFFLIGCLLFTRGIVGGGDVKLLAATILLVRYGDLFEFFVIMSVVGAVLSIAVIVIHNYLPLYAGPWLGSRLATARLPVPYGVAISVAGIVTLLLQPSLFGLGYALFGLSYLW
jgi:prepilin peptidase CpaA